MLFRIAQTKITTVLGPIVKAIQCLESVHTTCADVYLFFPRNCGSAGSSIFQEQH